MIRIKPVDRWNWESVTELQPSLAQQPFLQSNVFVLARAHFEGLRTWAIYNNNQLVGMAATACWSQVHWVPHIMIDQSFQSKGLGKEALLLLIEQLIKVENAFEIRASVALGNENAHALFLSCGFVLDGSVADESIFILTLE